MSKKRGFTFYPSHFLIGSEFFSNEQVGKYIKLLCYNYEVGSLTKEQIIHITGDFDEEVMKKFTLDANNCYFHERVARERIKGDTEVLGHKFEVKKKYHEERSVNRIAIKYAEIKKQHLNSFQIEDISKLFNDTRFKEETVFKHWIIGFGNWMKHEGTDKHNFKYLYAMVFGDLQQTFGKHKETEAVRKKQAENKEIERDRAAAARLEEEETYNNEAKTPAFELADMLNKKKIGE